MISDLPHRTSIRLPKFDYASPNWYFVTICTHERASVMGNIVGDNVHLTPFGHIVNIEWLKLRLRYPSINLDHYVIMPDHFHGIINTLRAGIKPAPTIGEIMGTFKSLTTREYSNGIKQHGWPRYNKTLWQRNYYDHIIRDEVDLNHTREYIINNPKNNP